MLSNDFNLAMNVLHRVVNPRVDSPFFGQFSPEYNGQGLITTALKIIHKTVQEGAAAQKEELRNFRHEVIALNALLSKGELAERVRSTLGVEMGEEAEKLARMKIALPQTKFEKMIDVASRVPRAILSVVIDIAFLPLAGILLLFMLTEPKFDPEQPKKDVVPILLLHGSGFNESEWIIGRQFLKKKHYGSVFSLNYDGLASNDRTKGIDDYAAGKVRDKILEIQRLTGQNRVILIGHSMGGMIAGKYAEQFSAQDGIQIEHVISISSPWQGTPAVDTLRAGPKGAKRYNQMSTQNQFRKELVRTALLSERSGLRNYYSIGSETDILVPGFTSRLTEDPRRQYFFSTMGHNGIVASPQTWNQIRSWLDAIYAKKSKVVRLEVQAAS